MTGTSIQNTCICFPIGFFFFSANYQQSHETNDSEEADYSIVQLKISLQWHEICLESEVKFSKITVHAGPLPSPIFFFFSKICELT